MCAFISSEDFSRDSTDSRASISNRSEELPDKDSDANSRASRSTTTLLDVSLTLERPAVSYSTLDSCERVGA
jgi:hypothetical protein